jgi:hypothetical protein
LNIVDEAQKPKIARTKKTPKKADHVPEFFSIDSENDDEEVEQAPVPAHRVILYNYCILMR